MEPTFLFPPENFTETVNETDSVTFVCVVVGIPAPSISFYQNGTLLDQSRDQRITPTDNSEPQDFQTADGTVFHVSRNLTISSTRDNDSGTYTCVASNAAANVTQDFNSVVQGEKVLQLLVNSWTFINPWLQVAACLLFHSCTTNFWPTRRPDSCWAWRCHFLLPGHWQTKTWYHVDQTLRHGPVTEPISNICDCRTGDWRQEEEEQPNYSWHTTFWCWWLCLCG